MSKHTPGPWTADASCDEWWKSGRDSIVSCRVALQDGSVSRCLALSLAQEVGIPQAEANARVMAAAPDLLAALKATMDYWDSCGFSDCDPDCNCVVQVVQEAIAKAEGR